ncbi:MAG: hypothetical protein US74_C0004G0016 [Parcubacteria group bacterium GW2011_GWA2_38_13]|nr:MAG: hypothetical protein US74_C0004G0016 [Parcubacteria group bacterium GW2011_GWA2_38_13]
MAEEKQNNSIILQNKPTHLFILVWLKTAVFGFFVFFIFCTYLFISNGRISLYIINGAIAETAMLLVGLSMILSSVSYFWNFADNTLIYRKYLGVGGLICGIIHALVILLFLGNEFPFPGYFLNYWIPISAGLLAIILFIFIVIISTKKMIARIGGQRWRKTIRYVGYIGYAFVIIHISMQKYPEWIAWISAKNFQTLLPLSIFNTLFFFIVIIMRLALWRALFKKSIRQGSATGNQ